MSVLLSCSCLHANIFDHPAATLLTFTASDIDVEATTDQLQLTGNYLALTQHCRPYREMLLLDSDHWGL